jgi:hypothetical protein
VIYQNEVIGTISLSGVDDAFDDAFDEFEAEVHELAVRGNWRELLDRAHEHVGDISDGLWGHIKTVLHDGGERAEQVIQGIPAGDPVFGCLIRSGLSTAIGHLIKCNARVGSVQNVRRRVARIARCLRADSIAIGVKFILRTLKCAATGGLDSFSAGL